MAFATRMAIERRQAERDAPIMALVNSYKSASTKARAALREMVIDLMQEEASPTQSETLRPNAKAD